MAPPLPTDPFSQTPPPTIALSPGPEVMGEVMEATGAGITVTDPRRPGNPLVYCNRAYLEMTGYGLDELLGRNPRLLHGPDTAPATVQRLSRALAEAAPVAVEILNYRKDGTPFWNALSVRPILAADGSARWFVGSSIDVSRQHQSERELRDAQQQLTKLAAETFALAEDLDRASEEADAARVVAETANHAKTRFLAMMSHELRTPMTAVLGMGDLLLATALTEEQTGYVKTLRSSADTLLAILNDILDFSKIEAGHLVLEAIDFSLERLIDDVVQLFLVRANAKGLGFSASLADDTPLWVRGDPTRLRQVLFNLVSNAIKFTERGGVEICVWCPNSDEDGVDLIVEVIDSGIGLTIQEQGRLFEAFVQADASTSRKYGGTGLGLAICRRLVQAMGGEIGVSSLPGEGSTFRFSIHVGRAEPPAEVVPALIEDSAEPPASLRLLLAEDNQINQTLIATMLSRRGHRVDTVDNGQLALEALDRAEREGTGYDVLLLDMEMPVMDGISAARAIRATSAPWSRLPILGLSADALPEHRERYMAAGLDAYLTKPIDWEALAQTIGALAGRPSPRPPPSGVPDLSARSLDGFVALTVVDRVKLSELRLALGADNLNGMLRLLPETALREMEVIRQALRDGRTTDIKRAAHTLAGVGANFGAPRMAAVARAINDRPADAMRVAQLVPVLEAAVAETARAFADPKVGEAPGT